MLTIDGVAHTVTVDGEPLDFPVGTPCSIEMRGQAANLTFCADLTRDQADALCIALVEPLRARGVRSLRLLNHPTDRARVMWLEG